MKRKFAADMAEELWERYCRATDPAKRRIYGIRYEFWANVRDNEDAKQSVSSCAKCANGDPH